MITKFGISLLVLLLPQILLAQTLQPFKDAMFTNNNRSVIESKYSGSFKRYYYNEMEDVNGRDQIPVTQAKAERVDLAPLSNQRLVSFKYQGGLMESYEVGNRKDAKFAVIFIHGGGGDKSLGVKDGTFGGNFNRLKNLAVQNGGVYYSPTVSFDQRGDKGVTEMINNIKKNSPHAKIVIACGSAGAHTCWSMADNPDAASKLSGIVLMGGAETHPNFEKSEAFKARVPLIISHGTKDPVVNWKRFDKQFESTIKANPTYPVKFELFEGGVHGTPIRMFDWKESLNWAFAQSKPQNASPAVNSDQQKTTQ